MNRISPLPKVRLRDGFSDRNRIKEENKNIGFECKITGIKDLYEKSNKDKL
jgi:hypothetical protein